MAANPDYYDACVMMLHYLEPKWHGSEELLVGFGKACFNSKNWQSKIPTLIAEAHFRVVRGQKSDYLSRYLRTDEVRDEIKTAYDEYLARKPMDVLERCKYAGLCYNCGLLRDCTEQFQAIGDNLVADNIWFSVGSLQFMRNNSYKWFPPSKLTPK